MNIINSTIIANVQFLQYGTQLVWTIFNVLKYLQSQDFGLPHAFFPCTSNITLQTLEQCLHNIVFKSVSLVSAISWNIETIFYLICFSMCISMCYLQSNTDEDGSFKPLKHLSKVNIPWMYKKKTYYMHNPKTTF